MPSNRKQGFASLSPAQRSAISRKGGRARVPKGFAALSEEQLAEVSRKGALKRWENKRKEQDGKDSIPSGD